MTLENQSYGAVRIESSRFGKPGVLITGLVYFFVFIIFLVAGYKGPEVFHNHDAAQTLSINVDEYAAMWETELSMISPENQLLWCTSRISRPNSIPLDQDFSYVQSLVINVRGSNIDLHDVLKPAPEDDIAIVENFFADRVVEFQPGSHWSSEVTLLNMHSVPYLYYEIIIQFENVGDLTPMKGLPLSDDSSMQADFRLTYVEADYTVFEMKWKTAFLFITILAMFFPRLNRGGSCSSVGCFASFSMIFEGFFAKLCTVPRKQWSYQQRWVGVLLIALFFFNDPLFRYSIYNDSRTSEILSAIYIGWMGAFLCLLMLFWLCALDETASVTNAGGKKLCGSALCQRHVAKFSFMFVYWFWFTTLFIYVRFQQDINPAWSEARSDPRFMPSVAFSAILVTVYDIWFLLYTCKALREIRRMPPPFLFVFVITFFTFAATCVGMYSGFMYPQVASSTDFLAMTAMYNLYVWTMAFIYAPLSSNGEGGDYGDFDLDVDSSVGVGGGVGGGDGGDGVGTTLQTRGGMEDMQL